MSTSHHLKSFEYRAAYEVDRDQPVERAVIKAGVEENVREIDPRRGAQPITAYISRSEAEAIYVDYRIRALEQELWAKASRASNRKLERIARLVHAEKHQGQRLMKYLIGIGRR